MASESTKLVNAYLFDVFFPAGLFLDTRIWIDLRSSAPLVMRCASSFTTEFSDEDATNNQFICVTWKYSAMRAISAERWVSVVTKLTSAISAGLLTSSTSKYESHNREDCLQLTSFYDPYNGNNNYGDGE